MDTLPKLFGASYVINLPERRDRLRSASRQFARVGWRLGSEGVTRLSGVRYPTSAGFPSAAVRGCFQSHLQCLQAAQRNGAKSVLIFEDDIALSGCLGSATPMIADFLDSTDWGFVYFGHYDTGDVPIATRDTDPATLRFEPWSQDLLAAHFYAVNGPIIAPLIQHLTTVSTGLPGDDEWGPMPVDGAYNIFRRKNRGISCFIANPRLGWQISSRSDITPHPLDRLKPLRPITELFRKFKRIPSFWRG